MLWFLESPEDPPPLPARSAVFVVRNGRYEPQNLMPVLPRMDILEFDGFVTRRGSAVGGLTARPPEMRQASLVSNPVSVRRDSVRARSDPSSDRVQFSMVLDTQSACTVSVHLLVTEVEQSQGPEGERRLELVPQAPQGPRPKEDHGAPEAPEDERPREGAPAAEGPPPWHGQLGALLDRRRFGAGLGQCYESPPLDLSQIPAEQLAFDVGRPADVPIAICLEPEGGSVEEVCAHYSYVSLQRATASSPKLDGCGDAAGAHWTAQVFAQKLQYQGNCFVLHDVFGVASKRASDYDGAETGSSECVICLSEPRDTAVLPCRHMCFCGYCAGIVRLQCEKCPVCRQKVKSLLQFKKEDAAMDQLMGIKPQDYDFRDVSQAVGKKVRDVVGDNGSAIKEATLQMDDAAKAAVAGFTGKETYEFGDISREVDRRAKDAVNSFTGKDRYEFGDITKEALKRGGSAIKDFTGKDKYEFGDISKTVWKNLFGDTKGDTK